MKRLTKRDKDGIVYLPDCCAPDYVTERKAIARLAEYEDMEEQGLLVRLPCKAGDIVYFLDICHTAVEEVVRCKDCKYFKKYDDGNITCAFWTIDWDVVTEPDAFCSYGENKEKESE